MRYKDISDPNISQAHAGLAMALLYDNDMWDQGKCQYFWGALPRNFEYSEDYSSLYNDLAETAYLWYQQVRGIHGAYPKNA